jgi:hypothetical protein
MREEETFEDEMEVVGRVVDVEDAVIDGRC